jgi:hypothetical protein
MGFKFPARVSEQFLLQIERLSFWGTHPTSAVLCDAW